MGHLAIVSDNERLERIARIERTLGSSPFVVPNSAARGRRTFRPRAERIVTTAGRVEGRLGRRPEVHFLQLNCDLFACAETKALNDQVEVIVVNPTRGEVI